MSDTKFIQLDSKYGTILINLSSIAVIEDRHPNGVRIVMKENEQGKTIIYQLENYNYITIYKMVAPHLTVLSL